MPKRRFKPAKPSKKVTKNQLLLPPILIGVATLAGIIIMQFAPSPPVLDICLKAHNTDTFNLYPFVQIFVDDKRKFLPDTVGKEIKDGKQCLHIIHTDAVGENLHIQYIRPIQLNATDFMKIYSGDSQTINVINNDTGVQKNEIIYLSNYDIQYSYYSENNEFTAISTDSSKFPSFTNDMVVKIELRSK